MFAVSLLEHAGHAAQVVSKLHDLGRFNAVLICSGDGLVFEVRAVNLPRTLCSPFRSLTAFWSERTVSICFVNFQSVSYPAVQATVSSRRSFMSDICPLSMNRSSRQLWTLHRLRHQFPFQLVSPTSRRQHNTWHPSSQSDGDCWQT